MTGAFAVIDGPDGVGKTTLVTRLVDRLTAQRVDVVVVREPGGTDAAELARRAAFDPEFDTSPMAELFFILAARADLVSKIIRPALTEGKLVLSDRYQLSTVAYQIAGRGLPAEPVHVANNLATGGLSPDLTVVLDVPLDVAQERQRARGDRPDRMEQEAISLHERVVESFRVATGPGIYHIDATGTPDQVEEAAWQHVAAMLEVTLVGNTRSANGGTA